MVVRGPVGDELDNAFNEIRLGNGGCRGFSANGSSYAIDGLEPWSMGGARTPVLGPGGAGSSAECGRWINDTAYSGGKVTGYVHVESNCDYASGQTHKSMELAESMDEGLTWTMLGAVVSGTDAPTQGAITGEGDCTVVDGLDGYAYLYCLRARDWRTIVARAPIADPAPGNWIKYHQGTYSQPGVGGDADSLGFVGHSAALWSQTGQVMLVVNDPWFGGVKLSLAADKVTFETLSEPLIPVDAADWSRPAATDLISYVSMMNPVDLDNIVDNHFLLTHLYVMPNEAFDQRYLVFRDVTLWRTATPAVVQVGIELARWYDAGNSDRWSTTAPVPGSGSQYVLEATHGFLMTAPHPSEPSVLLEDCVSHWPGHPDHLLTSDGSCQSGGYTRLRSAGWVYQEPQLDTLPLYRCYNPAGQHHFASNDANCEGLGDMEWLLGYVLAN